MRLSGPEMMQSSLQRHPGAAKRVLRRSRRWLEVEEEREPARPRQHTPASLRATSAARQSTQTRRLRALPPTTAPSHVPSSTSHPHRLVPSRPRLHGRPAPPGLGRVVGRTLERLSSALAPPAKAEGPPRAPDPPPGQGRPLRPRPRGGRGARRRPARPSRSEKARRAWSLVSRRRRRRRRRRSAAPRPQSQLRPRPRRPLLRPRRASLGRRASLRPLPRRPRQARPASRRSSRPAPLEKPEPVEELPQRQELEQEQEQEPAAAQEGRAAATGLRQARRWRVQGLAAAEAQAHVEVTSSCVSLSPSSCALYL